MEDTRELLIKASEERLPAESNEIAVRLINLACDVVENSGDSDEIKQAVSDELLDGLVEIESAVSKAEDTMRGVL